MPNNPKMLKILMLSHSYPPHVGGNGRQCKLLSEALSRAGLPVIIVTKKNQGNLSYREHTNGVEIQRVFCLSATRIKSVPERMILNCPRSGMVKILSKALARLFFYLDELLFMLFAGIKIQTLRKKICIIHVHQAHWIAYCGAVMSKIIRKPLLIKDATLNGFSELRIMPFSNFMRRRIIQQGHFAAISSDIAQSLINNGVSKNKVYFVPNGVLIPNLENQRNLDNNEVLYVGNYIQGKIKGLDILLQAMISVIEHNSQARLLIIGNGDPAEWKKLVPEQMLNGQIRFMGKMNAVEYFEKCSIFVLPSRSEGMSNALMEAMSFGMACISTRVSGSKDLIREGFNGILVDINNKDMLAAGIMSMLDNKEGAFKMGQNARKTMVNHYQIDMIAQQYIDIYRQICEN